MKAAPLTTKRLFMLVIPIAVLVLAICVVSISYAWFAATSQVFVTPLNISTTDIFTVEFSLDDAEQSPYAGQMAFDSAGTLINTKVATDGNKEINYRLDMPYIYRSPMNIVTDSDVTIDFTINFTSMRIFMPSRDAEGEIIPEGEETDLVYFGDDYATKTLDTGAVRGAASEIPYGFTWFIEAVPSLGGGTKYVYAPYGDGNSASAQLVNSYVNLVSDVSVWELSLPSTLVWSEATNRGIQNFATASGYDYYFCFVFAPEKLYWSQFADQTKTDGTNYDRNVNISEVYTAAEIENIAADYEGGVFYSASSYTGCSFYFTANIVVSEVHRGGGA